MACFGRRSKEVDDLSCSRPFRKSANCCVAFDDYAGFVVRTRAHVQGTNRSARTEVATYGFLGYPLLQTCDIAIVRGEHVPVGTRSGCTFGVRTRSDAPLQLSVWNGDTILVEAQPTLTDFAEVPGTDGRKMAKSYDNTIIIADDEETTTKKVRSMITDPQKVRRGDPGHPEVCPVFALWKFVTR